MPDPNELDTLMAAKAELTVEQCALALENTIDVHTPLNEKRHIRACIETVRACAPVRQGSAGNAIQHPGGWWKYKI